jgi:hypothetical protein
MTGLEPPAPQLAHRGRHRPGRHWRLRVPVDARYGFALSSARDVVRTWPMKPKRQKPVQNKDSFASESSAVRSPSASPWTRVMASLAPCAPAQLPRHHLPSHHLSGVMARIGFRALTYPRLHRITYCRSIAASSQNPSRHSMLGMMNQARAITYPSHHVSESSRIRAITYPSHHVSESSRIRVITYPSHHVSESSRIRVITYPSHHLSESD